MKWLLALALVACATSRHEQVRTTDEAYLEPQWWVCRPDLPSDACRGELATTVLLADGSRVIEPHAPAHDATIDCFYIYPTVDLSIVPGNHVDFSDLAKIRAAAAAQIARFSEVCNVYAPLYRQATIATYFSTKGDQTTFFDVAYSDIAAAFDAYLTHFDRGHRIVIIGHSQGSQMAARLLAGPVRSRSRDACAAAGRDADRIYGRDSKHATDRWHVPTPRTVYARRRDPVHRLVPDDRRRRLAEQADEQGARRTSRAVRRSDRSADPARERVPGDQQAARRHHAVRLGDAISIARTAPTIRTDATTSRSRKCRTTIRVRT